MQIHGWDVDRLSYSYTKGSDRDPVFYYESSDIPGLCVQRGDGKLSWSPMKVSKSAVKVGIPSSSGDSDLDIDHCTSFDYQVNDGVPGFNVA